MTNAAKRARWNKAAGRARAKLEGQRTLPLAAPAVHAGDVSSGAPDVPRKVVFASGDPADAWVATALFSALADPVWAVAILAARLPNLRALSLAAEVMREIGLDPTGPVMREPTTALFGSADVVVTMGGSFRRELLSATPHERREHWLIPEAIGATPLERARHVRELIRSRVAMLILTEGWERPGLSRDKVRVTRPRGTLEALASL